MAKYESCPNTGCKHKNQCMAPELHEQCHFNPKEDDYMFDMPVDEIRAIRGVREEQGAILDLV